METLTTVILLLALKHQRDLRQAEQRIKQAQYIEAVEAQERYRQSVLAQMIPRPEGHLSQAEEATSHKAEIDRWLIMPDEMKKLRRETRRDK